MGKIKEFAYTINILPHKKKKKQNKIDFASQVSVFSFVQQSIILFCKYKCNH